jgi:hypothetical protein
MVTSYDDDDDDDDPFTDITAKAAAAAAVKAKRGGLQQWKRRFMIGTFDVISLLGLCFLIQPNGSNERMTRSLGDQLCRVLLGSYYYLFTSIPWTTDNTRLEGIAETCLRNPGNSYRLSTLSILLDGKDTQ